MISVIKVLKPLPRKFSQSKRKDFRLSEHLKEPLEKYIKNTPVIKDLVRVARMPERGGLIRARQFGAKLARSDVLIFLDSHTEANYNWLPPLLGKPSCSWLSCKVCENIAHFRTHCEKLQNSGVSFH
jgi:hypothetical protein